jgi:DUF177 domain-containing protein
MTLGPIDVRDLVGRPGTSREVRVRGCLDGLGTELASVSEDSPIEGALLLESVLEGVAVSGRLTGTFQLSCARCLREFEGHFEVGLAERFVLDPDDDEYALDPAGLLDPNQMVRDVVGVELPFSPLCSSDCLGLCPVCGGDRNEGECPGHDEVDPRWEGLEALLGELDPSQN